MESGEDDGDKGGRESYIKFAKVMERMIGMLYEVCEGGELWKSHSVKGESCVTDVRAECLCCW